jgi:hypothetical protein
LISAPDTLAPVTQSWHLLSRYQASAPAVNGAQTPGSAALSSTRRRDAIPPSAVPVRRITWTPVITSYLPVATHITPGQVALQRLLRLALNVLLIPGTGSVAHLRET